ncbi:MAG: addiction module protein [Acidobacteria bacterium]|nr:addiction module protein [Acidobacteriota bacterium]
MARGDRERGRGLRRDRPSCGRAETASAAGAVCRTVRHRRLRRHLLRLDEPDRASIAGALIESLHAPAEPGAGEAWDEVIRRRVAELDAGQAQTVPWSAVRARLFDGFE